MRNCFSKFLGETSQSAHIHVHGPREVVLLYNMSMRGHMGKTIFPPNFLAIQYAVTKENKHRGVARILGKGVLSMCARSTRANFGHAHLRNGKVEVQIITENVF